MCDGRLPDPLMALDPDEYPRLALLHFGMLIAALAVSVHWMPH